jgi:hypothetical protein
VVKQPQKGELVIVGFNYDLLETKVAEGLVSKNSRGDWIRTSDLLNPIQAR